MNVPGCYRCGSCEAVFDQPDGPVYECGRCSGEQVGPDENRCAECRIFMSKVADACCPECQCHDDLHEITAWRGADGHLYPSEEDEAEWVAGTEERERTRARAQDDLERRMAEWRIANTARNTRLLPRMRALMTILGDRCPRLRDTLAYNIADVERDPGTGGFVTAFLYFEEMADLFAPDMTAEMTLARDWNADHDARRAAEAAIRARITAPLPPTITARMQGGMFSAGSGVGYEMGEAVEGLLAALEG